MAVETIRQKKLADQIKKLISVIVDRKIKDPNKGFITITHVKISGDLRIASVYFTALGDREAAEKSLEVLNRAKNFIRSEMAPHLKVRFIPELRFFIDDTFEYAQRIENLLKQIKKDQDEDNSGSK
ncbi:MAG: 30S ribosome-binding factor RbfA [Calditrichaeota bacterium]|nr:30S ribosome-binding factor RbfA [Calditrichota bacterium]